MHEAIRLRAGERTDGYIPLMQVVASTTSANSDTHKACIRLIFRVMEMAEGLEGYVQEIEDYPKLESGENYAVGITLLFHQKFKMLEFVKMLAQGMF